MTGRLGAKCPEGCSHMRNQWKKLPGRGASWCKGPVVDVKCLRIPPGAMWHEMGAGHQEGHAVVQASEEVGFE